MILDARSEDPEWVGLYRQVHNRGKVRWLHANPTSPRCNRPCEWRVMICRSALLSQWGVLRRRRAVLTASCCVAGRSGSSDARSGGKGMAGGYARALPHNRVCGYSI